MNSFHTRSGKFKNLCIVYNCSEYCNTCGISWGIRGK